MITALIFSKNRACQLELLLRSIKENTHDLFDEIIVLYSHTSRGFQLGYEKVSLEYDDVRFFREDDFCKDTKELLAHANKYICFFVDDDIIYRKCPLKKNHINNIFTGLDQFGCFSLRLGLNTNVHPYTNPPTKLKINPKWFYDANVDDLQFLLWRWNNLPRFGNNFGYAFSVDGHIYNKEVLCDSITYNFKNPNVLEGNFKFKNIPPIMGCLKQNVVVNNPLNLVGSSNNIAGHWYGHTLEQLNSKFLSGKRINLDSISRNDIVGCHQEMEIEWE